MTTAKTKSTKKRSGIMAQAKIDMAKPRYKKVQRTAAEIARDHEVVAGDKFVVKGTQTGRASHKGNVKEIAKQPISTRLPAVAVEYDALIGGKTVRRRETFENAHEAKRFYAAKDAKGKNPQVLSADGKAPTEPTEAPRPRLKDVFPLDPIDPNWKPTLLAAGDPTVTAFNKDGKESAVTQADPIEPAELTKEAKKKAKADKQLRRQQRKGRKLWLTPETKTVTKAKWQKVDPRLQYERWFLKFSDGTEECFNHLTVVHSRDHDEHHIRTANSTFIDGLSNKDYELVLRKCAEYAAQAARKYQQALNNFKSSKDVQKEMDKKISKAALKAEEAMKPEEIQLATKIAELANFLCCAPNLFFASPTQQAKIWIGGANNLDKLNLLNHGIEPNDCTIRVIQYARRIHANMIPRLEIGGERTGTPELAAAAEKARKDAPQAPKEPKAPKAPKTDKPKAVIDAYGNKEGTGCALINAEIMAAKLGTVFNTEAITAIAKKTDQGHAASHFRTLSTKGFLVKLDGIGFVRKGEENQVRVPKANKAKSKQPAKGSKKTPKPSLSARQAKANKGKPAKTTAKSKSKKKKGK